ncbi:MAG: choice-of-anchor B family protein [Bacteroidota bacterium]
MKRLLLIFLGLGIVSGAAAQANYNLTLAGTLTYGGQSLSNICGWVDPQDNKEYALVGAQNGLSIVDVTNPAAPTQIVQIPGPSSTWREIKVWGNYAYVTTESGTVGLQIVDLLPLPSPSLTVTTWQPTINSQTLEKIHALHIDAGRVYLYGGNVNPGGIIIADISTTPMAPVYLGRYSGSYVHDGYVRNNICYAGHIYDGWFSIMDVSNPANPQILATQTTPGAFTHNTWLPTTNANYLFTTDEVSNSYLTSYDISNISNITELDRIQSQFPGSGSIGHNTHIINVAGNDYAVTSWYKDGIVITDVNDPNNLVNVAWYDTYTQGGGSGFSGAWGVYPYLPSGNIVVSDINNGLFVLSPNYQKGCFLNGQVTDFSTGLPINAATITIVSQNITDASDASGNYATGIGTPGTYSVTYSKPGYFPQTINNITLSSGNTVTQNVALIPMVPFALTGQVVNSWNSVGVPNAHIRITNGTFTYDTITDANGNYTFPTAYAGTYEITAGKWLYQNNCMSNIAINSTQMPPVVPLDTGIYDDFTWNYSWTVSGNATTGMWERGEPLGTTYNNPGDANPEYDASSDCSVEAYVTGNTGTTSSDDDVDNGYTLLVSPQFSLANYSTPIMYYSRWFFNDGGFSSPNDSLKIYITNGTQTVLLETVTASTPGMSSWVPKQFSLNQYITPTATMRVRVRCADAPQGNLVEGGFDHFRILDSLWTVGNSAQEMPAGDYLLSVYPNPTNGTATVEYHLLSDLADDAALYITDLTGRTVAVIPVQSKDGSVIIGQDLGQGIYFVRIVSGSESTATLKVVKTN